MLDCSQLYDNPNLYSNLYKSHAAGESTGPTFFIGVPSKRHYPDNLGKELKP